MNFVAYKYGSSSLKDKHTMQDLARMFLMCINKWKLEAPSVWKQNNQVDDVSIYKVNYTRYLPSCISEPTLVTPTLERYVSWFSCRWLCYCHVPMQCESLPAYETTQVFGRTLLKWLFEAMRKNLLDRFELEKDKMPQEKRALVLTHFPVSVQCHNHGIVSPVVTYNSTQLPLLRLQIPRSASRTNL